MSSRSAKRGRKDSPNSDTPAKEMKADEDVADSNDTTEAVSKESSEVVKKGRGRPRKEESEKKKWVPTGRSRGRPRIYPIDTNKVQKPRGRPRSKPESIKEQKPRGRPRSRPVAHKKKRGRPCKNPVADGENKSGKVTVRKHKKPGRPRKE